MNSLDDILSEIDRRTELIYFFEELINPESIIPRVFFLHRQDLFPGFEQMDIMAPLIFWMNKEFRKIELTGVDALSVAKRLNELETMKSWDVTSRFFSSLFEEFGKLLHSLFEKNPELQEQFVRAILEKEKPEPKQYKMPEDFDPKQVESKIKKLISQVRENPLKYLATLTHIWPDIYFYLHVKAQEIVEGLLEKAEIDFESYKELVSQLFALRLVENLDARFWCNNCSDPFVLRSESNLGPKSLKLRCMKCGRKMAICSIYRLDNFLWKLISSKDGLLRVTVAWLLKRRKIEYESPFFVKETELDFICNTPKGKVLLECKMHRVPVTDRSVRQKLIDDLNQMRKHMDRFENESKEKIHKSYLIYNFDLRNCQDLVEEETKNYRGSHVIDFNQLDEVVASLAPKED